MLSVKPSGEKTATSRKRAFNQFAALVQRLMDEQRREEQEAEDRVLQKNSREVRALMKKLGLTKSSTRRKRNQK